MSESLGRQRRRGVEGDVASRVRREGPLVNDVRARRGDAGEDVGGGGGGVEILDSPYPDVGPDANDHGRCRVGVALVVQMSLSCYVRLSSPRVFFIVWYELLSLARGLEEQCTE